MSPRLPVTLPTRKPTRKPGCAPCRQGGFTLIEMLVVLSVIAVLMGLSIPAYRSWQQSQRARTALALVDTLATAAIAYGAQRTSWPVQIPAPGGWRVVNLPLWDVDRDGILDGLPATLDWPTFAAETGMSATDVAAVAAAVSASGYQGLVAVTGTAVPERLSKDGRVFDPTRSLPPHPEARPLRITWASEVYAPAGFAIWIDDGSGVPRVPPISSHRGRAQSGR